ncbi:MAG: cytochrome c [Methylotenera sp.]|nr:cytochrome c [Methylotenera sp.]
MNTSMKKSKIFAISYISAAITFGVPAIAISADMVDVGKMEYRSACAACHGASGKGDGPLKSELKSPLPDLTSLAKNNNGVYPFDRVYQIIDGRAEVKAHGSREMPVWGRAFNLQTSAFFENYPANDTESAARSRILALTEYLYRLQNK